MPRSKIFGLITAELAVLALAGSLLGVIGGILTEGEIQASALRNAALMAGIFLLGSAVAALRITNINVMKLMKAED